MKNFLVCISVLLTLSGHVVAQEHPTIDQKARQISAQELQEALGKDRKIIVIDVRTPQEFAAGHIRGAVNIPIEDLTKKLRAMNVPKDTMLVTVCAHGGRSSHAAVELEKLGYKTSSFCTLDSWKKDGYRIETGSGKAHANVPDR